MKLVGRDFVGVITEVGNQNTTGWYKVEIPELVQQAGKKGIYVVDESNKYWFTNSSVGSYGSFFPLQKGTKVIVRFKNNNLNSGYIDRIFSYDVPGNAKTNHPLYFLLLQTPGKNIIYTDDKENKMEIQYSGGKGKISFEDSKCKFVFDGDMEIEASGNMFIRAAMVNINDTTPSISSSSSNVSASASKLPIKVENESINKSSMVLKSVRSSASVLDSSALNSNSMLKNTLSSLDNINNEKIASLYGKKISGIVSDGKNKIDKLKSEADYITSDLFESEDIEELIDEYKKSLLETIENIKNSGLIENLSPEVLAEIEDNDEVVHVIYEYYPKIGDIQEGVSKAYKSTYDSINIIKNEKDNVGIKYYEFLNNDIPNVLYPKLYQSFVNQVNSFNELYNSLEYSQLTDTEKDTLEQQLLPLKEKLKTVNNILFDILTDFNLGDTFPTVIYNYEPTSTYGADSPYSCFKQILDIIRNDANYQFIDTVLNMLAIQENETLSKLGAIDILSNIDHKSASMLNSPLIKLLYNSINELITLKKNIEAKKNISTLELASFTVTAIKNIVHNSGLSQEMQRTIDNLDSIIYMINDVNGLLSGDEISDLYLQDLLARSADLGLLKDDMANLLYTIHALSNQNYNNISDIYSAIDTLYASFNDGISLSQTINSKLDELDSAINDVSPILLKAWKCIFNKRIEDAAQQYNLNKLQNTYDDSLFNLCPYLVSFIQDLLNKLGKLNKPINNDFLNCMGIYDLQTLVINAGLLSVDITQYINNIGNNHLKLIGNLNKFTESVGKGIVEMISVDALTKSIVSTAFIGSAKIFQAVESEITSMRIKAKPALDAATIPELNSAKESFSKSFSSVTGGAMIPNSSSTPSDIYKETTVKISDRLYITYRPLKSDAFLTRLKES